MNATRRPISIWVLCCLYIAVGTIGFTYHFPELMAHQENSSWIELTELLAIVAGVFMLRRHNWARWLALVWMAFHVAISFPVYRLMAIHLAIFAGIAWVLFSSDTRQYFAIRNNRNSRQSWSG